MTSCTPIYHITHINNFPVILKDGALWSDAECIKWGFKPENIAYEHLKQRRLTTPVPIAPGGTLADYTPFYFCNRSPMLCAISRSRVDGSKKIQANIIYLVSTVEKIANQCQYSWCFTDGHGVEKLTRFYNDYSELINIDWELIKAWDWRDTLADNDRRRRKQAEFLVHKKFSVDGVEKIGVYNREQKTAVESMLAQYSYKIPVVVEKGWYYLERGHS